MSVSLVSEIQEPIGKRPRSPAQIANQFKPGQSGNAGGRPANHVQSLARRHTEAAVMALVAALDNPRERVPAAVALLERGWGKPVQPIEGDASLALSWVVRAPVPVESTEEWFKRYAPPELEGTPQDDTPAKPPESDGDGV
jgi:hypothetical protein